MRCSAVTLQGLAGLFGCASDDDALEGEVDYLSPTGVAIGDDILVAMTRIELGKPNRIDVARDSFHATFVRRDGGHDGEIDVATEASPVGTIGLAPPCAGNAKVLALLFRRPSFSGSYLYVARVSDTGTLLDPDGIQIAPDGNDHTAGEAQLAVTEDGGVLAALHSGTRHDARLTPIGRDGKPGDSITLAAAHRRE